MTSFLALMLAVACQADSHGHDSAAGACPFTGSDVRLDSARIAGLSTTASLGRLRTACPAARLDTVGVGGTQPLALSFAAPGALVSAIQTRYEAYDDSVHSTEPADLWVARGDSLRFPDGVLMPSTVVALRALDSAGVLIVDHGDDGTGSYIVRCRYRFIAFVVSNAWPTLAETGALPLTRIDVRDTTHFWRVELRPSVDSRIVAGCTHAPAT